MLFSRILHIFQQSYEINNSFCHKIAPLQLWHFAQKFGFFFLKIIAHVVLLMLLRPVSHFLSASLTFFTPLLD